MELNPEQLDALEQAEPLILKRDYSKYLRLKELQPQQNEFNQVEFRRVFESYYGLNAARPRSRAIFGLAPQKQFPSRNALKWQ